MPEARAYGSPTTPQPPLSAADTLAGLALDSSVALLPGLKQLPILVSTASALTSRGLPRTPRVGWLLLSPDQIQQFADDHGDVGYLEAHPTRMTEDTAIITITQTTAFRRPNHQAPVVHDGGIILEWLAVRRAGEWIVIRLRNYIVLD